MTKSTEQSLKRIAKSLEEVVHLLKGDRPGVLKEPAPVEATLSGEAVLNIAKAVREATDVR